MGRMTIRMSYMMLGTTQPSEAVQVTFVPSKHMDPTDHGKFIYLVNQTNY